MGFRGEPPLRRVLRILVRLPLYEIEFSREGSYETLAKMLGQDLVEKWPQNKVDYLRHAFLLFKRAYLRAGGDHLDITPAEAMLVYLNVYSQDRLLDTPTDIVVNRLCNIWRELVIAGKSDEEKVDLVKAPSVDEEETPAKSTSVVLNFFMDKTVYSVANPLRIAFIHEFPCATSSWDSLHDQGRQYLDEHFGGIVRTEAFEDCHDPDVSYAAVGTAVKHGANVIFSTSHRLMEYTLRAAVEYPQARFLNCSIGLPHQSVRSYFDKNWDRCYELIVRSLLHGTWDETSDDSQVRAVNYWYGMNSGAIDIRYAPGLPYQTRKLVQLLRNGIVEGSINPFGGELHSQAGVVQIEGFPLCRVHRLSRWTGWQTTW